MRRLDRFIPYIFFITLGLGVVVFLGLVYFQYLTWRDSNSIAKYLVPPYQSIWYVVGYVIGHYVYSYIISLGVAFLFLGLTIFFNEKFQQRFFENNEPYLGALAIFLLGNPWWLYYLVSIILIALGVTSYCFLIKKENVRFSLYYLWLPVAVVVFLVSKIAF